jgi:hypothetical protein
MMYKNFKFIQFSMYSVGGYRTHVYNNIITSDPSIALYISNITLNISLQMYIRKNYNTFFH